MNFGRFDFQRADYAQKERMKAMARVQGITLNDKGEITRTSATHVTSHRTVAQDKRDARKARNLRR